MESQQLKRAKLYAQLASIESLDTLKEWEKLKLIEEAKQAGYELLDLAARFQWEQEHPGEARLPTDHKFRVNAYKNPEKAWHSLPPHYPVPRVALFEGIYGQLAEKAEKGGRLPAYWEALQRAHPWARNLIGNLFNGGWVVVRNKDLKLEDHWALTLEKNREVKQHFSAPDVQDEILFDLVETLKRSPFPFRSCPICRTIFVPVRKQKYCSPACTARAFSSAENPARREYMRKFVAKQREKANTQNRAVKKQPTKRG